MSTIEELGFPAPTEEAAPPVEAQQPPATEVVRDERGRFAPRDRETMDALPEGDEPVRAPDGYVPVSALQKMREEMRELKQQLQPKRAEQDDDAFFARMSPQQQAEWNYRNDMLNMHEASARAQFGADAVEEAKQWFQSVGGRDPALAAEINRSPFPYEALVQHYIADLQAQQIINLLGQGFDPFQPDQWALERARALAAQQQAPPHQSMPNAPRSIAGIPSAGGGQGTVPVGPGQAFDSLFK